MESGLQRQGSLLERTPLFWLLCTLVSITPVSGNVPHTHSTLSVSAPHQYITCPVGSTAQMTCTMSGTALHPTDILKYAWLFTSHSDQPCHEMKGPRNAPVAPHSDKLPEGVKYATSKQTLSVELRNITMADQGRYCCIILDTSKDHQHKAPLQRTHSHLILHVTPWRNGTLGCSTWDIQPAAASVPVALAVSACIVALLSMPLILLLVYNQRNNAQSSRRAHELVRMDSEAQGHENPAFLRGSPQVKTRTASQIMTRQASDTGRHLLSDPGTPLSPPGHGDVFFPIHDAIPEFPEFQQV